MPKERQASRVEVSSTGPTEGPRASRTRARILSALQGLLSESRISEISVGDIANVSDLSPATFYRYYSSVEAASLALAGALITDVDEAARFVRQSWDGPEGMTVARRFVEAFLDHWDRNRPVLRMRNSAAEEMHTDFWNIRHQTLLRITPPLSRKIRANQTRGRISDDIDPATAATMLVAMLERVGAFAYGYPNGREAVVATATYIVWTTVCGSAISAAQPELRSPASEAI